MRRSKTTRTTRTDSRQRLAQSEVVGVILIFGITMTGIGIITLTGFPTLDSARDDVQFDRALNEMMRLDSKATGVASGSGTKKVRMNLQKGSLEVVEDTTRVRINVTNTAKNLNHSFELNSVRYTMGDREVWFEAGGIFRKTSADANATMVSAPDFGFSRNSLTVSLVNVSNTDLATAGGQQTFTLSRESKVDRPYRDRSPIRNGTVYVNVTSPHSEAWERYFEDRHKQVVVVESNHDASPGWVKVRHVNVVKDIRPFRQAALSSGTEMELENATIDAYSYGITGDYSPDDRVMGVDLVESEETILFPNNPKNPSHIYGNVVSNDSITGGSENNPKPTIHGDAIARNDIEDDRINITGENTTGVDVDINVPEPVASRIVDEIKEGGTSFPNNPTASDLDQRRYLVSNNVNHNSGTMIFDTRDHPITVAIENKTNFRLNSDVKVKGNNPVRIYRGDHSSDNSFRLTGSEIITPDNRTDLFQVYVFPYPDTGTGPKLRLRDGSIFRGVIYAPNNDRIFVESGTEVYGSIIAEEVQITDSALHYNTDLRYLSLRETDDPTRAYLHVTKSDVNVSG
ncbi:MAG: hypothetical protein SV253_02180 [Halobacteria archaeon]|nr:hypothetical protein [Halobacteria archaeon]